LKNHASTPDKDPTQVDLEIGKSLAQMCHCGANLVDKVNLLEIVATKIYQAVIEPLKGLKMDLQQYAPT